MSLEMWFVLIIVILMLIALMKELARPDVIMFTSLFSFIVTGIITVDEGLKGFSNEGMLTIALLFIFARAIQKSGVFERTIIKLLKEGHQPRIALVKLLTPVALFSAFLNNTPIVATLTPVIKSWCEKYDLAPSKFLMPLSFATILGGMITLIGTSTNLVVHGMLLDYGLDGFSFFQLGYVGIPVTIIGLIYLTTLGYRLLPERKSTIINKQESKEYLVEMVVEKDFPFINKTIKEAGLRKLKGLYLFEVIRGQEKLSPVKSTLRLQTGDQLIFTGLISTIAQLERMKGLKLETGSDLDIETLKNGESKLVEVVVSHQSSLLHRKIKDTQFRSKFDAAVIAVHRNQERIHSKIGDIVLKPGDILLLLTGADFQQRVAESNDFYVTTKISDEPFQISNGWKSWFPSFVLVIMLLLVVFELLSMFVAAGIGVIIMLLTGIISPQEAKRSIHLEVLIVIACAFGVGMAIQNTGLATKIATILVQLAFPFGIVGILLAVFLLTMFITELVTNNATAVIMFPIGMEVASQIGVNPIAFAVLITIGASASFMTPIGYQTNLIVYGPGGYRFIDYIKVGFPLSVLLIVSTILLVYFIWV